MPRPTKDQAGNRKRAPVRSGPSPLALERRLMFDGAAAADTAAHAIDTTAHAGDATHTDAAPALLRLAVEGTPAAAEVLKTLEPQVRQELHSFFARDDWKETLASVFTAAVGTPEWNQAADALKQAIQNDTLDLRVEIRSSAEMDGAHGAFAARGTTGEPTLYLDGDWLAGATAHDGLSVLLEEIGHSFDAALNGAADTPGDEGELFASVVTGELDTSKVIDTALDNDAHVLSINGQSISVETATPSDSGWITIGRASDPDKGGSDGNWTAAAPDIVSDSSHPYLQYMLTSSNTVLNVKFRLEKAPPKDLEVDYGQMLFDMDSDGIPEFGLFLHVVQKNGYSRSSDVNGTTGLVVNDPTNYTYLVYLVPLDKSASTDNTRPNNTTFDSQHAFLIYDSSTNKSATGTTGAQATGNHYNANVNVYFALAPETDLDGDSVTENYYLMNFDAQAYSDFATYANALGGRQPVTAAAWPTGGTPGGNPVLYGAAVSATQQNSVNGDIGGGAYTGSETWRTIFGINDAPVPKANTYSTQEDTLLTGRNVITNADPSAGTDSDTETATASLTIASVTIGATTTAFGSLTDGTGGFTGYKVLGLTNGTAYLKSDGSFQYMPNANSTAGDSFSYKISDGTTTSATSATVTLNVTAVNDAPVAVADTNTAVEAGGVSNGTAGTNPTGNVLSNDTDVDSGDTRSVTLASKSGSSGTAVATNTAIAGLYGTLTISSTGAYTYTVDNSNSAVQALRLTSNTLIETFNYTIADAAGATGASTLTITIQGANDNPVASNDYDSAKESLLSDGTEYTSSDPLGSKATGNVLTNDTDVDRNGETKTVSGLVGSATVSSINTSGSTSQFTFQPGTTFSPVGNGDEAWYKVADGDWRLIYDSGGNRVTATGSYNSTTRTIPLSALPDSYYDTGSPGNKHSVTDWNNVIIGFKNNDSATNLTSNSGMKSGTVSSATTTGTTTVTVSGPSGAIAIGMTVTGTNVPASTSVSSVNYDGSGNITSIVVNSALSSVANGTTLSFSASAGTTVSGRHGTLALTSDGTYTYTPTNNNTSLSEGESFVETFKYTVADAAGATDQKTLFITVYGSGTNDPDAKSDSITAVEAGGVNNNTAGTDPTGNVLTGTGATGATADTTPTGTLRIIAGRAASDSSDTAIYATTTATTTSGGASITVTSATGITAGMSVTGTGIASGTTVTGVSGTTITLSQNATASGTGVNVLFVAATSTDLTLTGLYGTLVLHSDGSYAYTVNNSNSTVEALRTSSDTLTDAFTYQVANGAFASGNGALLKDTTTVKFTIQGANDNPVAANDSASALEAGGVSNGSAGSSPTGNVLTNDTDVDSGDGKTVKTAAKNGSAETAVSTNTAFVGLYGTLTISSDGSYSYAVDNSNATVQALAAGQSLDDVFSYTLQDTALATSAATLTITINGANDAPTAKNNTYTATEDALLAAKNIVTDNDGTAGLDADPEGSGLSISSVNGIPFASLAASIDSTNHPSGSGWKQMTLSNGTLYIKSDGATEYMPGSNATAGDSFTYTISDGSATSSEATVIINVTPVNDAPSISATPGSGTVNESSMSSGTDSASPYEYLDGYFTLGDPDGLTDFASIAFKNTGTTDTTLIVGNGGGQYASLAAMVGASFTTSNGTVTLTGYDSGTFSYRFQLTGAASNSGTTTTNAFTVQATDSGNVSASATVTITIADDTPTLSAMTFNTGDTLTVDETSLSTDATANFADDIAAARVYGADGAGSTAFSLVLSGTDVASGLYAVDATALNGKGAQIVLNQAGNVITGSATVSGVNANYFTITLNTSTGVVSFDQLKAMWHGDTSSADDTSTLTTANASDIVIRATVTDGDGTVTTGDLNLGTAGAFKVKDDGPTAASATPGTAVTVTLDETNLTGASISGTGNFTSHFSTAATVYGTDGAGSIVYALNLTGTNVASGLYALDTSDTVSSDGDGIGQGSQIVLNKIGNDIVGTVGATEYLRFAINSTSGVVTFTQSRNLWHSNTSSSDETVSLTLGAGVLTLTQTVTDADGDASSVSYDVGAHSAFKVKDDGPTAASVTPATPVSITLDETTLAGSPISGTGNFIGYFSTAASVYGTDGAGNIRYALDLTGTNVASGLYALDAADAVTTDGDAIGQGGAIVLNKVGNDVVGTVGATEYLRLSVDATTAVITFTQSRNLWPDPAGSQPLSILPGVGILVLRQTVTEADGDTASVAYDIGANGSFKVDAAAAVSVNSITVNEASPYAVFTVTGRAGQLVKLELGNTATTTDADAMLGTDTGTALQYYNGTAWVDYTAASFVNIPLTSTTMRVRVAVNQDTVSEGAETLTLTATNTGGTSAVGTGTIVDDGTGTVYDPNGDPTTDTPDDDRPLAVNSITVNETSPYAVFTVTGNSGQLTKLTLGNTAATTDVDATLGTDTGTALKYYNGTTWVNYTANSFVAIPTGSTTMRVRVAVNQDTVSEGAETLTLTATNTGGTSAVGTGTIVDDGTGTVYDPNGDPTTDTPDDDRPLAVNSITVNEASPYAVFTVTGNSGQLTKLTLGNTAATTDVDATLGTDTGVALQYFNGTDWVNYTPDSFVALPVAGNTMMVRTTIKQDAVYEGAETFTLTAANTGGTDSAGIATIMDDGSGTRYPDNKTGMPDGSGTNDDDRPLAVNSITVNEASPYAVFTVTANAGQLVKLQLGNTAVTTDVDATLGADTGTALQYFNGSAWVDYTSDTFVSVAAGGNTLLVRTTIKQDGVYEGAETFTLTASNTGGSGSAGIATIRDDGAGEIYADNTSGTPDTTTAKDDDRPLTVNSVTVNEASPYAVFTVTGNPGQLVKLQLGNTQTTSDVDATLGVDTANAGDGVPLQYYNGTAWVDYAPGSYVAIPQGGSMLLVRTAIVNDGQYEGAETFNLIVTNTGGASAEGVATLTDDGTGIVYDANGNATARAGDDDRPKPQPPVSVVIVPPAAPAPVQPQALPAQQPFMPAEVVIKQSATPADPPSLTVASPIPDQFAEANGEAKFAVPEGTFMHSNAGERLSLAAQQADGSPLPTWLAFDGTTGVFSGKPPPGFQGELQIKVIARDSSGNEVESMFRFSVGDKGGRERSNVAQPPAQPDSQQQGEVPGQPGGEQRGEIPPQADPERQGAAPGEGAGASAIVPQAKQLEGRASLQQQLREQRMRVRVPAAKLKHAPPPRAG